jgi:hypothetical protein
MKYEENVSLNRVIGKERERKKRDSNCEGRSQIIPIPISILYDLILKRP